MRQESCLSKSIRFVSKIGVRGRTVALTLTAMTIPV